MYMHLYAEATLALVETPCQELQFKQTKGDFQILQGKIMVQQDGLSQVSANMERSIGLSSAAWSGQKLTVNVSEAVKSSVCTKSAGSC